MTLRLPTDLNTYTSEILPTRILVLKMPPRRRTANNGQSTLAFGSQARVTKPVTAPQTKALDSLRTKSPSTPEPQLSDVPETSKPHFAELVVRQQATTEVQAPHTEEDKRALELNKQDIWRYWRTQDETRLAPPGKCFKGNQVPRTLRG